MFILSLEMNIPPKISKQKIKFKVDGPIHINIYWLFVMFIV